MEAFLCKWNGKLWFWCRNIRVHTNLHTMLCQFYTQYHLNALPHTYQFLLLIVCISVRKQNCKLIITSSAIQISHSKYISRFPSTPPADNCNNNTVKIKNTNNLPGTSQKQGKKQFNKWHCLLVFWRLCATQTNIFPLVCASIHTVIHPVCCW